VDGRRPWSLRLEGSFHGRPVYRLSGLPLIGHIAFGVIDRGTNVVQVRPSTLCPHNCIFCSVDAGPRSRTRATEYLVEPGDLLEWFDAVARVKGGGLEALIDGVGEPLTHPEIPSIVEALKEHPAVERVAVETHGGFLTRRLVRELEKAGLDRINLSVDSVDPEKARLLAGVDWYDVRRVLGLAEWIIRETSIDVVLTPVVVPGYNEDDMRMLVEWAKRVGPGRKSGWPTGVLIQKYEVHRYGRKPRLKGPPWSWQRFYRWLRRLEEETGYKLLVEPEELGFEARPSVEKPFKAGERVRLVVVGPGWHRGEQLAVDRGMRRVVALIGAPPLPEGSEVVAEIIRDKDNIFLARPW